jgi:hypothetical protein
MNIPNRYTKIQELYKSIKNDDLNSLKNHLLLHPEYLEYSNKYGNSLLSYSLEKKSKKIASYLLEYHINKLKTDKTFKYDILKYLINKNSFVGLSQLFSLISQDDLKVIYTLIRDEPLLFLGIKELTENSWNIFINSCQTYMLQDELSFVSSNGLNIAHLIAVHNKTYCLPILKNVDSQLFYQIDNDTGSTPLLLAAKYANPTILEFLLNNSNITDTTFLNSNITHVGCLNKDINSFNFLLDKKIGLTDKNSYEYTPLMLSIFEKSDDKCVSLLPHSLNDDISDELLEASRSFNNLESFFLQTIETLTEHNIKSLRNNPEQISALFSSIFYYCNDLFLEKLKNSHLWTLIDEIKDNSYYVHQIYVSSIMNRKHMVKKINLLLEYQDILHANDTEDYYVPLIDRNKLMFKSIYSQNDHRKLQKSFCFLAALGTLPVGQIKDILVNSDILQILNEYDLLLLFSIGLKKQSPYILDIVIDKYNDINKSIISEESNYDIAIQNNLSAYKFNTQYNAYYQQILKHFQHIPINLLSNISHDLIKEGQTVLDLTNILELFNEQKFYKKDIISSVISNLLQIDNPNQDFLSIFYQKPNLLFYVFKSLMIKKPDLIKNNELFKYIITHPNLNHTAKNWKFIFSLSQSNNSNKHNLIKDLLPVIKMENLIDFTIFKEDINKYTIDHETWNIILNHIKPCKFFQFVLNEYLLDISLQQTEFRDISNTITIDSINTNIINTTNLITNIIKNKNHTDSTILFFENLFLTQHNPSELIPICLEYSNFSYLEHLISNHKISIIDIPLEQFWNNSDMTQIFELNLIQNKYQPMNDFLLFINQHLDNINSNQLNLILENFLTWYSTSEINQPTKLSIANSLLSILDNSIALINEPLLITLSVTILNTLPQQNRTTTPIFINHAHTIFDLIFKNKSDSFFQTLQKNKKFMNNKSLLSDSNQKIMNYYSLNNSIHNNTLTTKRNKI